MMLGHARSSGRSLLLAPVAALLLLSGCHSPDDSGTSNVSDLTGTITGTVQDTQGHAIAGATVRYSGAAADDKPLTATTNADGQFTMPGVVVSGVSGTLNNDANGPITLVVAPPAGYLGATVQASPTASSTGSVGGGTVFIDGFNVGVGIVKLPKLESTVSGVLRDASTGAAIGGANLSLTFLGVELPQTSATPGVVTSYDAGTSVITTSNASGNFTFPSVYDDSCVKFLVGGYSIQGISGSSPPCPVAGSATDPNARNFRTADINTPVLLATVSVAAPLSGDTIPPVVSSVDGVVDPTQLPALLESATTQFTIHFSENMAVGSDPAATVPVSDVSAVVGAAPNNVQTPVTSSVLTGNTLVIKLGSTPAAGVPVTISIKQQDLKDTSGNTVADNGSIAYDSVASGALTLSFITPGSTNAIADPAPVAQVSAQAISPDLAYLSTDALLDTVDPTTVSIRAAKTPTGGSTTYPAGPAAEQLNDASATTNLMALLQAVAPDDTRMVQTGVGRVRVTVPANAADFVVSLTRSGVSQNLDVSFFPVYTGSGDPQATSAISNNGPTYVITPNGASTFDILIRARTTTIVQPGDVFHITSRNAAAALGGSSSLALVDNGLPTVALQLLDAVIAGGGSGASGGGGGVVIPGSDTTPSTVLLSITPQSADVDDTSNGYNNDNWQGADELQGLSNTLLQQSAFAQSLATTTSAIGDATGTAAFLLTAPNLGIAITELGSFTGTAPAVTGTSVTLSNSQVINNVTDENNTVSDLFVAKVSNIFQLATNSGVSGSPVKIDLTASIKDLNGKAPDSGTRAFVQLRDYMPPLLSKATYDSTNFVFTFNEAMRQAGNITFTHATGTTGCTGSIPVSAMTISSDKTTFTIAATSVTLTSTATAAPVTGTAIGPACFDLPAYPEAAYGSASVTHAAVSYADVPDAATDPTNPSFTGNTWTFWTSENLGIGAPYFAMANTTP